MKRKLLGYAIATVILGVIFWRIDRAEFVRLVSIMDWTWFAAGMAMFIPAYLVVVARLRFMFNGQLSFRDALTSILAASSLNIILPSKGGDLVKGIFIKKLTGRSVDDCLAVVLVERVTDVSSLAIIMAIGLIFLADAGVQEWAAWLGGAGIFVATLVYFYIHLTPNADGWLVRMLLRVPKVGKLFATSRHLVHDLFASRRILTLYAYSLLLWMIHIAQFYCLFAALDYRGPIDSVVGLVPATLIVGLIPITVAGIGTRDAALIVFFAPWASAELMAGVALFSHLRYFLPAIIGLAALRRVNALSDDGITADEVRSDRPMAGSPSRER
jgi:uncharacterized protein (TIRG00374 family)